MTRSTLAGLLCAVASSAFAQEPQGLPEGSERPQSAAENVIYPANFYEAFQPQTALDMLKRTPGFSLDVGGDARGFGGNAGNVLINGQRPTVKTGGIDANLARISAASVERIELLRGARTADAAGKTVIANIVMRADAGGSGNGSFELRRSPGDSEVTPRIDLNYSLPIGGWQSSVGAVGWYENNPQHGRYRLFSPDGQLLAAAREGFTGRYSGTTLTGSLSGDILGGTLSLNGQYGKEREHYYRTLTPLSGADYAASALDGVFNEKKREIGGDWTRPVGGDWTIKGVGLWRSVSTDFGETYSAQNDINAFDQRNRMSETVLRATIQRQGTHAVLPEIGGEIAGNRLNSRFSDSPDDDAAAVRVKELRGEIFVNLTIGVTAKLRLESGIALEASRIEVNSGDVAPRSLSYLKPSGAVVWDMGKGSQLRLAMRREVGQLDFESFAASGDLINNRPISGNAELQPEVTTRWSATFDHRSGKDFALSLTVAHETIKDGLVYVPLGQGGQALANFGDVRLWRVEGEVTVPVDKMLRGGRFSVKGDIARTSRLDPVNGARRRDAREENQVEVAWRHDLPKLRAAWGVSAVLNLPMREWFVNEYQHERYTPYFTAYAEAMLPLGVKATLTASGLSGEMENRRIDFYTPDRGGSQTAVERRRRQAGTYVNLLLSRQF